MTPTEEQQAIIKAAVETSDSLLVNALAGAAKTTTLELICKALPVQPILSLAFNKRIAEEMTKRLPGHVQCRTLNAIGHRVWMQTTPKKIFLNTKKNYELLKARVDALPRDLKSEAYDDFAFILRSISRAKLAGYIPKGTYPHAKRLLKDPEDIFEVEDPPQVWIDLLNGVLTDSIKLAYEGQIDFDDQIYMPTLFGGSFPKFPLVMVDEAQDLSAINHEMLKKLVTSRLIAVGDPWQSIYAFRGAVSSGMERLRETFKLTEMTLSISFRCPRAIVRNAHWRVPHMRWPEWAKEGHVHELETWSARDIPDGAAIICRNNAPLFSCALALIRRGRGVKLVGSDIGPSLIRTLKKLGPETMVQHQVFAAIDRWEEETLRTSKSKGAVRDKADCLRVFAEVGDTLAAAIAYAEDLFKREGPIQLLSGHKSKGLEWPVVYHLDPWRIPSDYAHGEALEQEYNVRYVIETRAKEALYKVRMDGLQ